jgi:hypothetical protein
MVITDPHKYIVTGSGQGLSVRTIMRTLVRKLNQVTLYTYILTTNRDLLKSNFTDVIRLCTTEVGINM